VCILYVFVLYWIYVVFCEHGGVDLILRTCLPSVLWHFWLGHLIRKNPSPIWPILCLAGRQTNHLSAFELTLLWYMGTVIGDTWTKSHQNKHRLYYIWHYLLFSRGKARVKTTAKGKGYLSRYDFVQRSTYFCIIKKLFSDFILTRVNRWDQQIHILCMWCDSHVMWFTCDVRHRAYMTYRFQIKTKTCLFSARVSMVVAYGHICRNCKVRVHVRMYVVS